MIKKKQLFSIRKFSVGVASVLIGASMLNVAQPIVKTDVQAKDKIEVEATQDVKIILTEENGGAKVNIQATKDLKNAEVKVTLDGKLVATYRIDNLKAGQSTEKEVTKEQLDKVKEELRRVEERRQQRIAQRQGMNQGTTQGINGQTNKVAQEQKTLPKTAVVRKNVSEEIKIEGHTLAAIVSYDVEENDEVKPAEKPTPEVVPTQPGEGNKPTTPEVKPAEKPTPEVVPTQPGEGNKPTTPEVKPSTPEEGNKPTPEVVPPKPETGDAKPSDKPGAGNEVKPEQPEVVPPKEEKEELTALRAELEKLVNRELRHENGYIPNQGNQTDNNSWIRAKTEAEKVLRNPDATKEQLEQAKKELEEKTYEAILNSEKIKVEKVIRAENKLELVPTLKKIKTLEELAKFKEKLVKSENPTAQPTPEKPSEPKPEEKPKPTTPEVVPPKEEPTEPTPKEDLPKPIAKPTVSGYDFDKKVVDAAGGEVNITIKGENLEENNVKIKVLDPTTASRDNVLSDSITYKKVGENVVATLKLPKNTTNEPKSFNLTFTDSLGMKATTTYTEERGENGRVVTILPEGKTTNDATLSFVAISSYQAHHGTDWTTTTTDKGNVSKKTVAHLYGTNLKADVTKVKVIDQNGVEWPIHTKDSNVSASDYPMMLIGKLGNGISGNGTYQEAEIVLPNGLDKDMTFTYIFAPDGVHFDEKHKVTAIVETTSKNKSAQKHTITVKYQNDKGETLKADKVLSGYSWFEYNVEKESIPEYKNIIVKDNKKLTGTFGTENQEIILVYTNGEVPKENQPADTPKEDTLETSKAKLKELSDRKLSEEKSYKNASEQLQSNWKKARAQAKKALAEDADKDEIDKLISQLENAITAVTGASSETPKPTEPKEENNPGNVEKPKEETSKPKEDLSTLKAELEKLTTEDPTKEANYKLAGTLQESAWKKSRDKAMMLLNTESSEEMLKEQIGKLTRALNTLKEENKADNEKTTETSEKETPKPTVEDTSKQREKLQALITEDIRTQDGYKRNNFTREYIKAKGEAKLVLENQKSTALELETAISSVEKAKNDALLASEKEKAKEKVLNSEKIQDKNPYNKRIAEATTIEAVQKIIVEVEKLNNSIHDETPTESTPSTEAVAEVTSYTGNQTTVSKENGKLLVTVKGKNLKASDLSFRLKSTTWSDVQLSVVSEKSDEIVFEYILPENLRTASSSYKLSAKLQNKTITANGAISFNVA